MLHGLIAKGVVALDPRGAGARRLRWATVAFFIVVLAALAGAGDASARSMKYAFTITGHGWGHGIGMSQWGAYGYAKHGWSYKSILKHYYTGISFADVSNSTVRVRLRSGLSAVKITCPSDFTVQGTGTASTISGGKTATTTYADGVYHVTAGSWSRDFTAVPVFSPKTRVLRLVTKTDLGDTGAYRGSIKVRRVGSKLMMVNHVPLESYLRGVVPHEVSPSWPKHALRAQACAARSYALYSLQPDETWDVYCDVRDQAYAGVDIEDSRTDAAVRYTAGVCPTYKGKPIFAAYFSCSGGHTENIELAWSGASTIAYLKGVSDPYDTYGSRHNWGPWRRTASALDKLLNASGSLRAVYRVKKGASPRIVKAAVIGSRGTKYVSGSSLRTTLGLYSSWATFRSMGISPSGNDGVVVSAGAAVKLKGRLYPAISSGLKVTLHSYYNGSWHTRSVKTTRATEQLSGGHKARYSSYAVTVRPKRTTKYYFSRGTAKSPTTKISVK